MLQLYRENPDEYLAEDQEEEIPADPKSPEIVEAVAAPAKKEKVAKVAKDAVSVLISVFNSCVDIQILLSGYRKMSIVWALHVVVAWCCEYKNLVQTGRKNFFNVNTKMEPNPFISLPKDIDMTGKTSYL